MLTDFSLSQPSPGAGGGEGSLLPAVEEEQYLVLVQELWGS